MDSDKTTGGSPDILGVLAAFGSNTGHNMDNVDVHTDSDCGKTMDPDMTLGDSKAQTSP